MAGGADFAVDLEAAAEGGVVVGFGIFGVLPRVDGGVEAGRLGMCQYLLLCLIFPPSSSEALCMDMPNLPFLRRRHGLGRPSELMVVPRYRADGENGGRRGESGCFP